MTTFEVYMIYFNKMYTRILPFTCIHFTFAINISIGSFVLTFDLQNKLAEIC